MPAPGHWPIIYLDRDSGSFNRWSGTAAVLRSPKINEGPNCMALKRTTIASSAKERTLYIFDDL
jgi:hypothetical protein